MPRAIVRPEDSVPQERHTTRIALQVVEMFRAHCTCGWMGALRPYRNLADDDAHDHEFDHGSA